MKRVSEPVDTNVFLGGGPRPDTHQRSGYSTIETAYSLFTDDCKECMGGGAVFGRYEGILEAHLDWMGIEDEVQG